MRVLAVGCHPDDLELHTFGTLIRFIQRGDDVFVCGVANGSGGSMTLGPRESAELRKKEAAKAAQVIGAKEYFNLDIDDLNVDARNREQINKVVDIIRLTKPDIIITHDPNDYMRDHNDVSKLVFDASFVASIPNYETKYPVHSLVPPLFYMSPNSGASGFVPTDYVDITNVIEKKLEALECHVSQVAWLKAHTGQDVLAVTRARDMFYGKMCGVEYGEAFARCNQAQRMTPFRYLPEGR